MTPITSLKGCFNGDGHTISDLKLTGGKGSYNWSTGAAYVNTGLIGELNGSVINLKMTGVDITEGIDQYNNVGALVGKIADGSESKIDNCTVRGTITSTAGNGYTLIGALVGMMTGSVDDPTTLTINNCVSDVALTGASSNYVGGLLGSAQNFGKITITKCAELGNLSGNGNSGGMIGYINSANTALTLSDSYVGGKVDGSKKGGIAFVASVTVTRVERFFYDNEKNKASSSYSPFEMLPKRSGSVSVTGAEGKSTAELKALTIDGFAVSADFGGYPVPVWTPAAAPEPITPPAPVFSCALTFTGTENGTITVKHGEDAIAANQDGSYTLPEAGDYTYTVTFNGDTYYNDIPETTFTVSKTDTEMTIPVALTYKTSQPEGKGTEASPYLIGTAAELRWLADQVNDGNSEFSSAYVKLTKDIVVPGSWTPLGKNAAAPFSGHFDGDGHSVTITVDDPSLNYLGFFGCLSSKPDRESATKIEDQPTVVVENLTVNGTVYCSEPYAYVGGLAGRALGKVEIKDCVNDATISSLARGSAGVGGLIGGYEDGLDYVYWNVRMTVDGCTNTGLINVTGDNPDAMVGGLVGSNQNCVQIKNSTNTGTINAPGCTVGGLLGQAGAQTGDYKPSIDADSANPGTLIGAEGKTNALYGKGYIKDSGNNTYTPGEVADVLLLESQKYLDVLAVPSDTKVGDAVTLLKTSEDATDGITVTCSQGEKDTNKAYLKVEGGLLKLAKLNDTGKVIEATATLTWTQGDKSLSKPVTVNIYPAASGKTSAQKALMDRIAATYTYSSSDWVVFDMAAYAKCGFGTNTTNTQNYLDLTINDLAGTTPLVTDRAKAEIVLAALGIDSTKLTPYGSETAYSNAAKLAAMDLGSSHYTAPWVLLAEQAGQLELTKTQRDSMISLLISSSNLGDDGLFFTKWAGETYADPDTTGTALAALAKFNTAEYPKVQEFIKDAVAGLSKAQRDNGSYGNVNSDAMVITGLTAIGIDPATDSRFVKGGCSLADALLLYVNDAGNGFTTGYLSGAQGEKAQALATEQGFRALVTLEQFQASNAPPVEGGKTTAFNIYTLSTTQVDPITWEPTTGPTPVGPEKPEPTPGTADGAGEVPAQPSQGGGASGGSGTTSDWITVTLTIRSDSADWYAQSLRTAKDSTVQQVVEQAAVAAGLTLDMDSKYVYLRAIVKDGVSLGQFDRGPNSGWMYKVDGKMPMVGMGEYKLTGGEKILLYYVVDYTKEDTGGSFGGGGTTTLPTEPTTTCPFTDLTGHWSKDEVERAWTQGLVTGMTETTFVPDAGLTRAMAVTMLHRMAGAPATTATTAFTDVPAGTWYAQAVAWAAETGVVKGMTETTFAPDEAVTRAQLATMLYRYAQTKGEGYTGAWMFLLDVPDRADIADWAYEAVCWLNTNDVLKGRDDGRIDPQGGATRAEAAALYLRLADKLA